MATLATRLGPADHGRAMTLEEFREAEEEPGHRYELARGVVEVTEVPNDPRGQVICQIYRAIALYEQAHPGMIQRYGGGSEFRLWVPSMASGRNPDVAIVLKGAPKNLRGRRVPALAIEVVSPGGEARDYEAKRQEYLTFGLFEYWVVNPREKTVTVLVRDGGVWVDRIPSGNQPIESLVLPGFATPVSDLWADAEPTD